MSRSALFKTTHPSSNLIAIEELKNTFLSTVVTSLFPSCRQTSIYQMSCNGQDTVHLMMEAIAFWYGSDYQDIEQASNLEDVFAIIL